MGSGFSKFTNEIDYLVRFPLANGELARDVEPGIKHTDAWDFAKQDLNTNFTVSNQLLKRHRS